MSIYRKPRPKPRREPVIKRCARCNKDRPHLYRYDRKGGHLRPYCRDCVSEAAVAWRQANWQREKLRNTYKGMIQRCTNRDHPSYRNYGALGVVVCKRWLESYDAFCEDVGLPPSPEHSLDRRRPQGDYVPSNCRWATPTEQSSNTRTAHLLTAHGITQTLTEWARQTGLARTTIRNRLKAGQTHEEAVAPTTEADVPF